MEICVVVRRRKMLDNYKKVGETKEKYKFGGQYTKSQVVKLKIQDLYEKYYLEILFRNII